AGGACNVLYDEEGSVVEQVGRLRREADAWAKLDAALADVARRLEAVVVEVRDLADTLRNLGLQWEADPGRLDEGERRITLLKRLGTKEARPIEELIAYRTALDEQELRLQQEEDDLASISTRLTEAWGRLRAAAAELSKGRQRVAKRLASETQKNLTDLGMAEARLEAVLETTPLGDDPSSGEVPADGSDKLELMLTANRGEPPRPLRKIASGGEMARTMLALKTVLAAHDKVATLIFDEIDANVGGRLGDVLGQKLAALGQSHQVICVTHL